MWILPSQLIQSHSLKGTEELKEALNLMENELDQSLLVKSKPMPLRTLSTRWKQGHWIRTLFGRMPKPSQARNFLDKWISLQVDSHANHLVQQDQEKETKTQDTYGQAVCEQLNLLDLIESSLKTWKDLSAPNLGEMDGQTPREHLYFSMCLESWKDEVTKQRGEYSQRLKQVHLTKEKESSSLGNWKTPRANKIDGTPWSERNRDNPSLSAQALMSWPTPVARDWQSHVSPQALTRKDGKSRLDVVPNMAMYGPHGQDNLKGQWKSLELSPSWVEQLMGLPTGLTDLGSWGME